MANSTEKKKWTIMTYMAGDNDLDINGVIDLKEMKKTGSTPDVNVIVQFDRAGEGLQTKRYYLQKGTSLNTDAVQSIDETNTGSPDSLIDFINWGIINYPADHYLLILWNHGQGWDDTDIYAGERGVRERLTRPGRVRHAFFRTSVEQAAKLSAKDKMKERAILLDDDAKDFLDNLEMKKVLKATKKMIGRKLDILGMDACLMNMAEVGYQVKDSVLYTVGSEETEPLDGWPYDTILAALSQQSDMSPTDLSKRIVRHYIDSYKGSGEAVTQSALDMSVSPVLASAVKSLVATLKAGLKNSTTRMAIADARNRVQEFDTPDNIDLLDFCQLLKESSIPVTMKSACDQVIAAIQGNSGFVISSGYYGAPMRRSNGVAIYFPTRIVSPLYSRLDFAKKTGWGTFLKAYINATRSRKG